jgi:predicted transcriptional regulator of viral defense system
VTYRETLRELADEKYGYITTREAANIGVPGVELRKLANRGVLRQVRRGVYRFADARGCFPGW